MVRDDSESRLDMGRGAAARVIGAMIGVASAGFAVPAEARNWRVERRDAVETVTGLAPDGARLVFTCRRGGRRPGTGGLEAAFPLPVSRFADLPATAALRLGNGVDTLTIPVSLTPVQPAPAPIRQGRGVPRAQAAPPADPVGEVVARFGQTGPAAEAETLARVVAFLAAPAPRGVGLVLERTPLSSVMPVAAAAPALAGMRAGCADGIPEESDEIQGPWHQGISTSHGEPITTLVTDALGAAPGGPPAPKLAFSCVDGDFTARLVFPGESIGAPLSILVEVDGRTGRLRLEPGPGPDEAGVRGGEARAVARLARFGTEARITIAPGERAERRLTFDTFGYAFAARRLDRQCPERP